MTELTNQRNKSITSYLNMSEEWVNGFVEIKCIRVKMNANKSSLYNSLTWKWIIQISQKLWVMGVFLLFLIRTI